MSLKENLSDYYDEYSIWIYKYRLRHVCMYLCTVIMYVMYYIYIYPFLSHVLCQLGDAGANMRGPKRPEMLVGEGILKPIKEYKSISLSRHVIEVERVERVVPLYSSSSLLFDILRFLYTPGN